MKYFEIFNDVSRGMGWAGKLVSSSESLFCSYLALIANTSFFENMPDFDGSLVMQNMKTKSDGLHEYKTKGLPNSECLAL